MIMLNSGNHKGLLEYHSEFALIHESAGVSSSHSLFGIQALIDNYLHSWL